MATLAKYIHRSVSIRACTHRASSKLYKASYSTHHVVSIIHLNQNRAYGNIIQHQTQCEYFTLHGDGMELNEARNILTQLKQHKDEEGDQEIIQYMEIWISHLIMIVIIFINGCLK